METKSEPAPAKPSAHGWLAGLNRNVIALGLVSLLTDVSSEMLMPVRFIFLVNWLGTPLAIAAAIEGLIEAVSSLLKVGVGRRTDRVARRGPMILLGYTLSNLSKPLIGWVPTWQPALGLLLVDRSGKAIRGAPRDALIADSVPERYRGKAFGFHRSMDTAGAAIGPLVTVVILSRTGNSLPAVFRWTIVPGVLAILALVLLLREPRRGGLREARAPERDGARDAPAAALGRRFWTFCAIWTLFSLGNSSDAFVFLRSLDLDSVLVRIPLYYAGFNITYAALATPLGSLSDRIGRLPLLVLSLLVFAVTYGGWALAHAGWQVMALFLAYGIYYAATEGVARAFVADVIPRGRRGSALGWFLALTGVAALPANLIAAYLWSHAGKGAPFAYGAAMAAAAALLLIGFRPWLTGQPRGAARVPGD